MAPLKDHMDTLFALLESIHADQGFAVTIEAINAFKEYFKKMTREWLVFLSEVDAREKSFRIRESKKHGYAELVAEEASEQNVMRVSCPHWIVV